VNGGADNESNDTAFYDDDLMMPVTKAIITYISKDPITLMDNSNYREQKPYIQLVMEFIESELVKSNK
jgi:hypothetical protein